MAAPRIVCIITVLNVVVLTGEYAHATFEHVLPLLQVLNLSDPYIPEGEEPPRLGAVPVRFFGTYAFSWIESKRAIEPFDDEHTEHAANCRQPEFQRGVTEAKHFQVRLAKCCGCRDLVILHGMYNLVTHQLHAMSTVHLHV